MSIYFLLKAHSRDVLQKSTHSHMWCVYNYVVNETLTGIAMEMNFIPANAVSDDGADDGGYVY